MVVLFGNATHQRRHCKRLAQVGGGLRLGGVGGEVVEPHCAAARLGGKHDIVGGLQGAYREDALLCTHLLGAAVLGYHHCAQHLAVQLHLYRSSAFCREAYRQRSVHRGSRRGYSIGIAGACLQLLGVIQVAPAVIPSIVVDLIERTIVVHQGVIAFEEIGCRQHLGLVIVLCQEVIAGSGIGIAYTLMVIVPSHGANAIKQAATIDHTRGQLFQVIRLRQIVGSQQFGLQASAVAVDLDFVQTGETCPTNDVGSQLIDASSGNADLHPGAVAQHGVGGIPLGSALRGTA